MCQCYYCLTICDVLQTCINRADVAGLANRKYELVMLQERYERVFQTLIIDTKNVITDTLAQLSFSVRD